jgi:hypothetical protein
MAIEVGRSDGPIQDPIAHPVPVTARLWGVSGSCSWTQSGEGEVKLESPMMVDLMAGSGGVPSPSEPPDWVRADRTGVLDPARRASGLLSRAFDSEKPADQVFRENVYHRQREMRQLARQSLAWIEDFELVVAVLNDAERYIEWPEVIDLLRDSVRRSPRTAQAVREAMGKVYGNRGDELYELLWKYDAKELSGPAAKQLVQYLEDKTLACRVLSFGNLNRSTGMGYYYRPEKSDLERRPSVQRWSAWADHRPGNEPPKAADAAATESIKSPEPPF